MNEVSKLITEAVQGVLEKLHAKEKIIHANKTNIRQLE
jgi:hypothetical protein